MTKTNPIFRILAIVLILASLGMVFLKWMYTVYSYYDMSDLVVQQIDYLGFGDALELEGNLIFFIATIVLLLTGILAIILAAGGVRGGGVPYFLATIFAFVVILYAMDWHIDYMGVGAWLCVAFALVAMILLFIPDNTARPATAGAYGGGYAPVPPRVSTWTCPKCGTILADRERFCPNCGNSRAVTLAPNPGPAPAVQRCASCGATLEKGASFCPNCGSPVGGARPAAAYTAPRTPSYPAPSAPSYPAPSAPQPQDPAPKGFHSAGDDDL